MLWSGESLRLNWFALRELTFPSIWTVQISENESSLSANQFRLSDSPLLSNYFPAAWNYYSCLFCFVCSRGDTLMCQDLLRTRKLCQSPINMSATYDGKCSRNQFLQWFLLWPRTSQQLSHFWIPKEPDELRDWPHKGGREGNNAVILFTFLTNSMPDPIKCPAWGPKMCRVFKRWVTKSTLTGILVNFNPMSSEPSMSCKKLDKKA